ncbi:MAG: ATP-binding protein [Deltaproteobacteria bacterium]|nr:ATP-binding protein [Deltaproteobacteria bacterium]
MIDRVQGIHLAAAARAMPVVTVMGPRQSGKTTLVKATFPEHVYLSLELPEERAEALHDPVGFLRRFPDGAILDEVQRAPELLSYLQVEVDRDDRAGRWVLTGSQNLLLMREVAQTLAGRTALFTLLPLSLRELRARPEIELAALDRVGAAPPDAEAPEPWPTLWAGFYPRIHDRELEPRRWLADYHRTYVERDLRELLRVMDLDSFERFVRLAAARTGQELNTASLAADAGISQPTAAGWLGALQTSYLIALVPPHHRSYRKRLRKRPKLHFLDSGLVCYLLDIRSPELLRQHPLRGAIFESFVAAELIKASLHRGEEPALFHWRDATGHEIDLIVDLGDRQIPVEVKSGQTVAEDALGGLRWWTGIADNPNRTGVLIHGGSALRERAGFCVRPWWIA